MTAVAHYVDGQPYGYVTVQRGLSARTVGRILDGFEVVGYALDFLALFGFLAAGFVLAVTA